MGFLSRKSPEQKAAERDEKARRAAVAAGVDVDGALAVAHRINAVSGGNHAWRTLVVRPDRVELHDHGAIGTPHKDGQGVQTLPVARITSVESVNHPKGWSDVRIHSAGETLEFGADQDHAPVLRNTITQLLH